MCCLLLGCVDQFGNGRGSGEEGLWESDKLAVGHISVSFPARCRIFHMQRDLCSSLWLIMKNISPEDISFLYFAPCEWASRGLLTIKPYGEREEIYFISLQTVHKMAIKCREKPKKLYCVGKCFSEVFSLNCAFCATFSEKLKSEKAEWQLLYFVCFIFREKGWGARRNCFSARAMRSQR